MEMTPIVSGHLKVHFYLEKGIISTMLGGGDEFQCQGRPKWPLMVPFIREPFLQDLVDGPGCYALPTANQCGQNGFLPQQTGEQLNPVNSEGKIEERQKSIKRAKNGR